MWMLGTKPGSLDEQGMLLITELSPKPSLFLLQNLFYTVVCSLYKRNQCALFAVFLGRRESSPYSSMGGVGGKGSREEGQMWTECLQADLPTMFMCGGSVACGLDCFVNAESEQLFSIYRVSRKLYVLFCFYSCEF